MKAKSIYIIYWIIYKLLKTIVKKNCQYKYTLTLYYLIFSLLSIAKQFCSLYLLNVLFVNLFGQCSLKRII